MRERGPDVVVVGAGIVGAACAESLARQGASVLVVESRFVSSGVTAAGMGHVVVMDDSPAQLALTARSRRLWSGLAPELPGDCEDDPCGTIWVAADGEEMNALRVKADLYRAAGIAAEILDAAQLRDAEPNLRPGLGGGFLVPEDRVVYPPNAARWLLSRARAGGARLIEGSPVLALDSAGIELADRRIDAGAVVNAAGPDAPRLTAGLPIEPRKGHLVITDRYPGFCRHQLVELGYLKSAHSSARSGASVAFNLQPRATGQMLLGSSREFAGWDASVDGRTLHRMVARALEFMPALAGLSALRAWTGFRPSTPDKLPLIGRWSDGAAPGPWIAAGHEGLGITTALATGEMLSALISGAQTPIDPSPFDPNRPMPAAAH